MTKISVMNPGSSVLVACLCAILAQGVQAQGGTVPGPLPSFTATMLTGQRVTEQKLIGQPTVLIVTPSRAAGEETRKWAQELRKTINQKKVAVWDVLAIDLPFFISESDALGQAREKIPKRYHDQTMLLAEDVLENALNIPESSEDAHVLVLNSEGKVIARVQGPPTPERVSEVAKAVSSLTG